MRAWLIHKLGGFTSLKELKQETLTEAVADIYNTVDKHDLLNFNGRWMHEGRELTEEQVRALKNEAEAISRSKFFRILLQDLDYQGNKRMIEAATLEQLEAAKLLIYLADILKTRIKNL